MIFPIYTTKKNWNISPRDESFLATSHKEQIKRGKWYLQISLPAKNTNT
jgi:hypothetical protein